MTERDVERDEVAEYEEQHPAQVECEHCHRPMTPGRFSRICERCLTASGE